MLSTRRSRYLGVFAAATVVAAAAQETSPDVSVEADSVFFDARRGNSVFNELSVSDGAFSGFANDDDKCVVSIAVSDETD